MSNEKTGGQGAPGQGARVRVTLVRGWAGKRDSQIATLRALGLRRRGQSNVLDDSPSLRGAIEAVGHLVRVEPEAWEPLT
jgi:large subunit ribosomal protein L30